MTSASSTDHTPTLYHTYYVQGNILIYFIMCMGGIGHLESRPSLYSLFLNHQGRVLYDALPEETLLVECDASLLHKFIKHLKLFRVKKKVDIGAVEDKTLFVVYDPGH